MVIAPAAERMKADHAIRVDRARLKAEAGGTMKTQDPVAQGRVQMLLCQSGDPAQAVAAVDELVRLSALDPDWQWRRTAIIAREWRRLDPVRAYAESCGIPVEMAGDTMPSLWRMREMQSFIRALLRDRTRLLSIADLTMMLNALPSSRWTNLIGEGIGLLARDLAEKAIPVPDIVEWFGEWSREARGEQRGLLLLTAHRAKGLEFDHVVVLDGGWDRVSKGEDPDAPRRLFYVAMTRARMTLTLMSQGRHALLDPSGHDAILARKAPPFTGDIPATSQKYVAPEMGLVDLSYAGRLVAGHASLTAIARAKAGDPVELVQGKTGWFIADANGVILGNMSRKFSPPEGATFATGSVAAILNRRKADSEETYHAQLRRDEWEVVLPELVFEAA